MELKYTEKFKEWFKESYPRLDLQEYLRWRLKNGVVQYASVRIFCQDEIINLVFKTIIPAIEINLN